MDYNIFVVLLMIFAGVFFGIAAIMVGIGGGLMNVPFLIYVIGLEPQIAGLVSSFVIVFTSFSGFLKYRSQKTIDLKTAKTYLVLAAPGAVIGGYLAMTMDPSIIKTLFAIMIGISSIRGILKALSTNSGKVISAEEAEAKNFEKRTIIDSDGDKYEYYVNMKTGNPLAFLGGIVAGLLGVGGGVVYMPLMLSITGVPVHLAVPTSTTMIVIVSIVAVTTRIITASSTGAVDYSIFYLYGLPLALGAVTGARIGAGRIKRIQSKHLLIAFWSIALISSFRMLDIFQYF